MKTRLLFFILLFPLGLFSQNIDSLKTTLDQQEGQQQFSTLFELGSVYLDINLDTSAMYISKALNLIGKTNNELEIANTTRLLGKIFYYKGNLDSCIFYSYEAVCIYQKIGANSQLAVTLNNVGIVYSIIGKLDSSYKYHQKALDITVAIEDSVGISETYNNIGTIYLQKSQYDSAEYLYLKAMNYLNPNDYYTQASLYNNIALVYQKKGDLEKTIDTYLKALELFEKIEDVRNTNLTYNNIGSLYMQIGYYDIAIEYFQKRAKHSHKLGDHVEYCLSTGNIASCYAEMGRNDTALTIYRSLIPTFSLFNDDVSKAFCYKGIADCLIIMGQSEEAIPYLEKVLKMRLALNDNNGVNRTYNALANAYIKTKDYNKAGYYFNKCEEYNEQAGDVGLILSTKRGLAEVYYAQGKYLKAFEYLFTYVELNDSTINSNVQQQISDLETKYQTEKKEQQIALQDIELEKNQETIAREKAESDKKAAQRNLLMIGFGLILVLVVVIYRGYKQKTQANVIIGEKNEKLNVLIGEVTTQKNEIEEQKIEIEEIHHEVSQSIDYAKRIQTSILPENSILQKNLSDHFVLFKPRDVVSGDFYWFTQIENKLFATVADCTGHGVPGAFMSMLGVSFLREIVDKSQVYEPNKILNRLRNEIVRTLKQKGAFGEQKDGMDMALIRVDFDNLIINYSGANNALYIVSKTEPVTLTQGTKMKSLQMDDNSEWTLYEVKPDKMPIAIYEKMADFTNHSIQLQKGDKVYMFSDGYVDQFGGEKGKKFMSKPFKRLLLEHTQLSMDDQKAILDETIENWMANHQQIDDISIMGIEV